MREKVAKAFIDAYRSPEGNRKFHKHLTLAQARLIQDALDPEGEILLGRDARGKVRNFIIVCLLLFLGLRIGELLSLRTHDIKFGAITYVLVRKRNMSPLDTRRRLPRVKRLGRLLPIDNSRLAILLDDYITEDREWSLRIAKAVNQDYDGLVTGRQKESGVGQTMTGTSCAYPSLSFSMYYNGFHPDQPDVITYCELSQASTFCSLCSSESWGLPRSSTLSNRLLASGEGNHSATSTLQYLESLNVHFTIMSAAAL